MNAIFGTSHLNFNTTNGVSAPAATAEPARLGIANPQRNGFLALLPEEAQERLIPNLELKTLQQGTTLVEPGVSCEYLYFPVSCLVSRQCMMEDGACIEVCMIGNDGVVGMDTFLGKGDTPSISVVQVSGQAFRLEQRLFREEVERCPSLLMLMFRYSHALIAQTAQTAVCNRHHTVDQQLCKWLLMSLDRLGSNELTMTQEQIANSLGVRRQSVTEVASVLQKRGFIKYSRGKILLQDRAALEKSCCECYHVVKTRTGQLMCPGEPRNLTQSWKGQNSHQPGHAHRAYS